MEHSLAQLAIPQRDFVATQRHFTTRDVSSPEWGQSTFSKLLQTRRIDSISEPGIGIAMVH